VREVPLTLERAGGADFPYYDEVSGRRWLVVAGGVVAGLAAFSGAAWFLHGAYSALVPTALFAGIPLAALVWATRGRGAALFHRVAWRDVRAVAGFAVLCIVVTIVAGTLVGGATAHPIFDQLAAASPAALTMFYPRSALQLLGEELLTILPFLALLHLFVVRRGIDRTKAIVLAAVLTAVWFGLIHLPTYGWNVVQCLVVVGAARLVLTWAYIRSKNLWVATGAHILNDWLLITPFLIGEVLSR
jgi:membrane protease YdiL (CAAX protease family)